MLSLHWPTFAIFAAISTSILINFHNVQTKPYMDEIFHIPQAQKYCNGNFTSWDPMITTLPGLYLITVGLLHPVSVLLSVDLCTTFWLRCVNLFFMCGNFYLIYLIYRKLHKEDKESDLHATLTAVNLSLFPVQYFFTFLYYTDPGSTFFVLLMYLFFLIGNKMIAAVFGVVAVMFRQTNIIWVLFFAGLSKKEVAVEWLKSEKKDIDLDKSSDSQVYRTMFGLALKTLRHKPKVVLKLAKDSLLLQFWFILVLLGFGIFVILNNGIAVGDRSNHEACLNFPQIFYFLCLTFAFSCMYMLSPKMFANFIKFSIVKFWLTAIFGLVSWLLIYKFTYVHKYILSDNRHYTFYVWSKIYNRHEYVKYALIPFYYYMLWSFIQLLKHKDLFFKHFYAICLLACTVPQKMMEFRYFIIPYLIFRLNMRTPDKGLLLLELLLYIMVNTATIYLFMYKPFKWPNSEEYQRFMW